MNIMLHMDRLQPFTPWIKNKSRFCDENSICGFLIGLFPFFSLNFHSLKGNSQYHSPFLARKVTF